ncbi:oxidoreductase [Streptomyces abyssalis]|uniref:Oxidoreductase n=1 Tax=Streptomyces abyssalis TaxID=933944 RepID=A0A1E7JTF1_9ACTN|nr:aldo/keto reductase [Streptomyces abyssalis]OEU92147.1 oxidoreductase [Streptomyces abyssalis]OEU94572.1 oxidoreductase [Streptomyces abyssalis]OEV29674.1 oxidoreductase [Streptomyces nanshensis]
MSTVPEVTLNNGIRMPQLGFGVYQVPEDETQRVVASALEAGYRSIDTAALYRNEAGTGRALAESGIPRDELFVTTKLWNTDQGHDAALRAFEESLAKLGLDHVDLYLVHWPLPARDLYVETWRALEKVYAEGRARAIGVSNFHPAHLRRLTEETDVVPAVNQIELHPRLQQQELRAFDAGLGIATEAWSPLGRGNGVLEDPAVTAIAEKHGRTPAQVVLRWHLQLGNIVIPKSATESRIRENLDVFGFELDEEDMAAVEPLETGARVGPDPDTFN